MKHTLTLLAALLLAPLAALHAATINLAEPLDYQVIQRTSPATGTVRLRGTLTDLDANGVTWEVRIVANTMLLSAMSGFVPGSRTWQ